MPIDPFRQRLSKRAARQPDPSTAPCVRVQTLGAARVVFGTHTISITSGLQLSLMVRLLYSTGFSVSREELLRELWPDQSDLRQRGNLRQLLYKLRTMGLRVALVDDHVRLDRDQVEPMFCLERSVELFDRDVTRGDEPFGTFLPGLASPSAAWDVWIDQTREAVHADVRRVLVTQLRRRRERGDWTGAEVLSRWLLQFDPLNEDATLTIAECTMMNGAKSEAVAIIDRYLEELGPDAGDIRLPATQLRKRFTEPSARRRPSLAATERHFVGREKEMAELTMQMRRARWHDGSAILLHGPAGIGKTRLCTELGKVAQIEGYREITIECRESEQHRPLGAVLEALPELMASPGALGCSPESLAVLKRLVGEEVGVENPDTQQSPANTSSYSDPIRDDASDRIQRVRAHSLRRAIVDLFSAVSDEQPIYFVVEDTHWIDESSWDAIFDVLHRTPSLRVFAIITSRYASIRNPRPEQIPLNLIARRLSGLDNEGCVKLARAIGIDLAAPLPAEVEGWLVSSSEGTPLMLRALVEHWTVTGDADGVPPSLTVLLDQRLDRLAASSVRALQTITILGRFASLDRIQRVLNLPTHEMLFCLEQLEESGCLAVSDASMVVSHDLIRQVAVSRMTSLVQATLRSAVAELVEQEYQESLDPELLLEAFSQLYHGKKHAALEAFLSRNEHDLLNVGKPELILRGVRSIAERSSSSSLSKKIPRILGRLESESGNFAQALSSLSSSVSLPSTAQNLSETELDERLSFVESAFRSDPIADPSELGGFAGALAKATTASMELRIRAADIGLVIASNTCDPVLARDCYEGLGTSESDYLADQRLQRVAVLYHTVFGSVDVAYKLAESMYLRGLRASSTTSRIVDCGRAGYVFRMTGHPEEALRSLTLAQRLAFEIDLPRLAEYPVWQLGQVYLELGDQANAEAWTNTLRDLASENHDETANSFIHSHLCLSAISVSDAKVARMHLDHCKRSLPRIPHSRSVAYVMALELSTNLLDPKWRPSEEMLEVATSRFDRTASFAAADLFASALIFSLLRIGDSKAASQLLDRYIAKMRREKSSPAAFLGRAILALGEA
ncbi:MAG: AAA family ATPase [Gemmatimonadaceae bacterium]|nr:AAA family ATPase [Gemmatimonadaceae bacterium]